MSERTDSPGRGSTLVQVAGKRQEVPLGATLFDAADLAGVPIPSACRRTGDCRECLVEIQAGDGALSPRSAEELSLMDGYRLACRARVVAREPLVRFTGPRGGELRIETGGTVDAFATLGREDGPAAMRVDGRLHLDDVPLGALGTPPLGLAVDVGTTTVVVRLVDLEERRAVATRAFENPQRRWAGEVISRVQLESESPGRPLQRAILEALREAISGLPCDPSEIVEVVVAGNTAMRDILFGLDVAPLGRSPFLSTAEVAWRAGERPDSGIAVPAVELGLPLHPDARVVGLPLIACHVGADAAAALLALEFLEGAGPAVLIDFGSNTEIVVRNGDRLIAASCPAGPAFEGGGVRCGMPAFDGAIERVSLEPSGEARLTVIGGGAPRGVCGSGLIDVLSELRRLGWIDERGRRAGDGRAPFALAAEQHVVVSERDISVLLQAKAANLCGALLTLAESGLDARELEAVHLAGGFIGRIDLEAARSIGFLPDLPLELYRKVGNLAIEGATMALCSRARRARLAEAVRRVEHLRLETHPSFFDTFVEGCLLRPGPVHRPG